MSIRKTSPRSILGPAERSSSVIRCGIYTRVSTDDQARRDYSSLDSQRDICEHAIAIHREEGWVSTAYFEDPGFSGKDMDRPGIQALLEEVERGNLDIVVAYKIDRITRSLPDFYEFWRKLEAHKVNFVSATQSFDTGTPAGMLMLNMLLSFGQFERELIAERTTHKMQERAKRGYWHGGQVPMGYSYDRAAKLLSPDPVEAPLVERIYRLTIELISPTAVAKVLNAEGHKTRRRTVQRSNGQAENVGDKRFNGYRIRLIVENPLYRGVIRQGEAEYPGQHKALVSDALWHEANAVLGRSRSDLPVFTSRNKHEHLLKGLLRCGSCGQGLTPKPSGKKDAQGNPYLYYTCNEVSKDGTHAACQVRNIPARTFDDLIVAFIGQLGQHPEIIEKTVATSNQTQKRSLRPLKAQLATLENRHRELARGIQQFLEVIRKKGADHVTGAIVSEADRLAGEKNEVEREMEKLRQLIAHRERVVCDEQIIADSLLHFHETFSILPFDDQVELIRLLIKGITVKRFDPEKDVVPVTPGTFATEIRTKAYLINVELYVSDLISTVEKTLNGSSHSGKSGCLA